MKTSNMDYEKKYKNALEWARQVMNGETGFIRKEVEEAFPELKESDDEKIRKHLISLFEKFVTFGVANECETSEIKVDDILYWLKKQGEHARFIEAIQVGDQVTKNEDGVLVNLSQLKRVAKPSEQKQGEQQPTDKVEPKFKVGDWVVRNGETLQISGIDTMLGGTFHYWFTKGTWLSSIKMGNAMLWTIQDAKDGDVLATEDWIFIFKKINSNGKPVCHCHYDIELGFRIDTNSYIATGSEIYPATKEQHDLLFQKMKEAGYEWDADKKELKKIEQKPTDSKIIDLDELVIELEETIGTSPHSRETIKDFFQKAVQKYMKCLQIANGEIGRLMDENYHLKEQKPALSEEEIENCAREAEDLNCIILAKHIRQLKSLRPQNTWKPSDEQMEALKEAVDEHFDIDGGALWHLYEDLKKLME